MKKFITALAATFATVVIGSAASAATPTFNVYHEEVLPALGETVADFNWDAIPTSERITSVTVANYNWEALPAAERVPTSVMVVHNFDVLPAAERTDVETFSVAGN